MKFIEKKLAIAVTVAILAFPLGASMTMAATTPAVASTSTSTPTPTPALDGAALYAANCAGCHNALASSNQKGATVSDIQGASGKMNISDLSAAELQAIANALSATPTTVSTPTTVPESDVDDGIDLTNEDQSEDQNID